MPRIVFKTTGGVETPVETTTGTTVLQAAWDNNIDIEGACEGVMACRHATSSWRKIIAPSWTTSLRRKKTCSISPGGAPDVAVRVPDCRDR